MGNFIKTVIAVAIAFIIFTFPSTWLLMLFFGNIGMELGYVATLPLGIVVSIIMGGVTARTW